MGEEEKKHEEEGKKEEEDKEAEEEMEEKTSDIDLHVDAQVATTPTSLLSHDPDDEDAEPEWLASD